VGAKNTTPLEAYKIGICNQLDYIEPFCTIDCIDMVVYNYKFKNIIADIKKSEFYGDDYNEKLNNNNNIILIKEYFRIKERVSNYFEYINFRVGNKDNYIDLNIKSKKGITFEFPKN
jgi:hypothetical protein